MVQDIRRKKRRVRLTKCKRCGGFITFKYEEPRCYICGFRNWELTDRKREVYFT